MAITDFGIEKVGSFIANESPSPPSECAFGTGSTQFDGTVNNLDNEVVRVPVSWSFEGSDPTGEAILDTTQGNDSVISELGLTESSSSLGSDLYTRELSGVGSKENTFDVTVQFNWRSTRI